MPVHPPPAASITTAAAANNSSSSTRIAQPDAAESPSSASGAGIAALGTHKRGPSDGVAHSHAESNGTASSLPLAASSAAAHEDQRTKKRRTGPGSRAVANLTPEQLAKKRANGRLCGSLSLSDFLRLVSSRLVWRCTHVQPDLNGSLLARFPPSPPPQTRVGELLEITQWRGAEDESWLHLADLGVTLQTGKHSGPSASGPRTRSRTWKNASWN
jgi:hypothetical protein